jgi:hypothetical protein
VADRNPKFSTRIPDSVGPKKLPEKTENDHMPKIEIFSEKHFL